MMQLPVGDDAEVAVLGDVIGSKTIPDRIKLHQGLLSALEQVPRTSETLQEPRLTVGDEFQAVYTTLGKALDDAFTIRLALLPDADLRFGIGIGSIVMLDHRTRVQDGPGWWHARKAIEEVHRQQDARATRACRTRVVSDVPQHSAALTAVNAALLMRDHLVDQLDERSLRLLAGALDGLPKRLLAEREGITASAVSQRSGRDAIDLIHLVTRQLSSL